MQRLSLKDFIEYIAKKRNMSIEEVKYWHVTNRKIVEDQLRDRNIPEDWIESLCSRILFPKDLLKEHWIWIGQIDNNGYGRLYFKKKNYRVHILISQAYGIDPEELFVLHNCDRPYCCNINHLRIGTHQDNMNDMTSRNRQVKGEDIMQSVLTEIEVRQILIDIWNDKYQNIYQIAKQYNCCRSTIVRILDGETWIHITNQLVIPLSEIRKKIMIGTIGENNGNSILIESQVRSAKLLLKQGYDLIQVSQITGINKNTVKGIKYGYIWKHIIV